MDIVEQALPEGGDAGGDGFGRGVGGGWGALGGEAKGYASISCGLQRALYCAGGWLLDLCDGLLGCLLYTDTSSSEMLFVSLSIGSANSIFSSVFVSLFRFF